jgi:hypothetical protein
MGDAGDANNLLVWHGREETEKEKRGADRFILRGAFTAFI